MAWVHHCATSNSDQLHSSSPFSWASAVDPRCTCPNHHTVIKVTCIYMTHIQEIEIWCCLECPAAVQLLERGMFPCAPVQPGLAVSLTMLEWASTLFLHMASNVQAWADTTEIMPK